MTDASSEPLDGGIPARATSFRTPRGALAAALLVTAGVLMVAAYLLADPSHVNVLYALAIAVGLVARTVEEGRRRTAPPVPWVRLALRALRFVVPFAVGLAVLTLLAGFVPDDPDRAMLTFVGALACLAASTLVTAGPRVFVAGLWQPAGLVAFVCATVVVMILLFDGLYGEAFVPALVIGVVSGAWFVIGWRREHPKATVSPAEPPLALDR
jgi:hypothetical protein